MHIETLQLQALVSFYLCLRAEYKQDRTHEVPFRGFKATLNHGETGVGRWAPQFSPSLGETILQHILDSSSEGPHKTKPEMAKEGSPSLTQLYWIFSLSSLTFFSPSLHNPNKLPASKSTSQPLLSGEAFWNVMQMQKRFQAVGTYIHIVIKKNSPFFLLADYISAGGWEAQRNTVFRWEITAGNKYTIERNLCLPFLCSLFISLLTYFWIFTYTDIYPSGFCLPRAGEWICEQEWPYNMKFQS